MHIKQSYHTLSCMRYLGVDYGSKKVGLALSDEAGTMGFPYRIVPNTPSLIEDLCSVIEKENIGAVVIGESRNLAGDENPIAKDARALGDGVAKRSGIPIFFESEVFTSTEARRMQVRGKNPRSPKSRKPIDDAAAALILTSFLSRIQHG